MYKERAFHLRKETEHITSIPLYAIEGIGGSGKSHTVNLIKEQLTKEGLSVTTPKIAGLGDSPRVQTLKAIKESRFMALQNGTATEKQVEDQQKDKIFRLAMYQQIKEHKNSLQDERYDIGIIDRTPLTLWVYNKATNPDNPYLDEILEEGLHFTEDLGLSKVLLFDVPVTTSYARIIARFSTSLDNPQEFIQSSCAAIGATPQATEEIMEKTLTLLQEEKNLQVKAFEGWDFIPFEVAERERELHKEALTMAHNAFGLSFDIINADAPLPDVVNQVRKNITSL